jgi:hypothetical protein
MESAIVWLVINGTVFYTVPVQVQVQVTAFG